MMRQLLWMAAPLALLWATQPASAQIVYEFADSSGTAQTNFTVPAGGTVSIKVFIHELNAGAPTLNSQGGLGTGAVRVRFNNPANIAAVLTTADITNAGSWQFFTPTIGSGANANTVTFAGGTFPECCRMPRAASNSVRSCFMRWSQDRRRSRRWTRRRPASTPAASTPPAAFPISTTIRFW